MNFIKIVRKKKEKIIIVFGVIMVIAFVGGQALQQALSSGGDRNRVIATYANDSKIKSVDLRTADNQLKVLEMLGAKHFLLSSGIEGPLLNQVFFGESNFAPEIYSYIKTNVLQGKFNADIELLDSFFANNNGSRAILWILLNYEADSAGVAVSNDEATATLKSYYSQATQQQGDASELVAKISETHNIKQEVILDIFARLLSVMKYTNVIAANANTSLPQIDAMIGAEKETVSGEYVKFEAKNFTGNIKIDEEKLSQQFDLFKDQTAGSYSAQNPYGFGYMFPDRVQLEYIIVQLSDVASTIAKPSSEEMEKFYKANKAYFTEQIPSDAENPDSEKITRNKTFAEVASQIDQMILAQKRNAKAEKILNDAKAIVEEKLFDKDLETITSEELKSLSGDYTKAAIKVSGDYGISVNSGTTGYLSTDDLAADMQLGMLMKQTSKNGGTTLSEMAFAVDGLEVVKLGKFSGKAPKLFENICPLSGRYSGSIAMVRVVDFKKAAAPKSIEDSYVTTKAQLTDTKVDTFYYVQNSVQRDCKLISAMYIAKEKAEDFLASAGDDWDKAVEAYNANIGENAKISLTKLDAQARISSAKLEMIEAQSKLMPGQGSYFKYAVTNKLLLDNIAAIAKANNASPVTMDFEADASVCAVKNASINEATTADYQELKSKVALTQEVSTTINAILIQYDVENIKARNNFEYIEKEEKQEDK